MSTKFASALTLLSMMCFPLSGRAQQQSVAAPVFNISVTTNGGSPSGNNYVYTISISDNTQSSIHYTLSLCGGTYTTSNKQPSDAPIVVRCTAHYDEGQATAQAFTSTGQSTTSYASF